jgi:hypothetical protein
LFVDTENQGRGESSWEKIYRKLILEDVSKVGTAWKAFSAFA